MTMTLEYGPSTRRIAARSDKAQTAFTFDAPANCGGPGENPCPVDAFGASLAACMVMAMDMAADRKGFTILGSKVEVNVESAGCGQPMLGKVDVTVYLPRRCDKDELTVLRKGAGNCPIHNSLKAEVQVDLRLENPDS